MAVVNGRITGLTLLFIFLFSNSKGEVLFSKGSEEVTRNFPLTEIQLQDDLVFPFFGQNYHSLYISRDGFVAFSQHARYVTSRQFTVRDEKHINADEDYPFVAPFYYGAADLGSTLEEGNPYRGKIYYNQLKKGDQQQQRELEEIGKNINASIPGVREFDPKYALVVTWVKVTDQYNTGILKCTDSTGRVCQANTFQAALVTNGSLSFAIFNYEEMNIRFPSSSNYQSGFNGGYGRGWSPAISVPLIVNITKLQASDRKGRYVYQINEESIIMGGCGNPDGKLEVVPDFAGLLGGRMVDVTGPCFSGGSYSLSFGNSQGTSSPKCVTEEGGVDRMKRRCEIPILTERGEVPVFMKAMDGKMYNTTITIVLPKRMPSDEHVQLVDRGLNSRWTDTSATSLYMKWNPMILSTHANAKVLIQLRGYNDKLKSWDLTVPITENPIYVSKGEYQFQTDDITCDEICQGYDVGVIEVELQHPIMANKYRTLRSKPTPLGWLVSKGMVEKYGDSWPEVKCQGWYDKDMMSKSWLNSLPACPCYLQQALVDIGRWQKDLGCNIFSHSTSNCVLHSEAVHCVRSVQPNVYGAGNQCCYRADGTLIYSADSYQGSTPDRSHDWGSAPYNTQDMGARVPSMCHVVDDVISFFYCCLWTGLNKNCDKYMNLRPTRDCTTYSSPKQAMVYGQGNVRTFDDEKYFVCGEGDFILLESTSVSIEGRFQKSPFNQNYNSTILTDVGIRAGNDVIEIKMKGPSTDRSKRVLDVLVNGQYQFLDNGPRRWKDFTDSAIMNSDDPSNTMASNVTVITKSGLGIQVAERDERLCLLVMIPPKFESRGLLGNWNNNSDDDLKPRNSQYPVLYKTPQKIYSQFVFSWAITKNKGTSTIVPFPVFATNKTDMCVSHPQGNPTCNRDEACNHDYWSTRNMTLAYATLHMSSRYQRIQEDRQPVRSCGLLDVPLSLKSTYNYSLGSSVTITGCRRGQLTGDKAYSCVANEKSNTQSWSPDITAKCDESPEQANIGMIVGIVVAVLVVVIFVVIIALVVRKKRSGSMKEAKKREPDAQQYSVVAQKEPKI